MSTSKFDATTRAARIAAKSVEIDYKESKIPDPSVDFTANFKANTSATKAVANLYTVDVLPNFVPIMMFIMFHASQLAPTLESRSHAKVSIPTFCAYCLSIVYGHFLLHDMYIRPSASSHAQNYRDSTYKTEYASFLATLPVPTFLEPLLRYFTVAAPAQTPNVIFCPSAAGFSHKHHFGRLFPMSFFTSLHDIAATYESRLSPAQIRARLFTDILYTITRYSASQNSCMSYSVAHYIGACFPTDPANPHFTDTYTGHHLASRLNQMFDSVFNPVLFRDYQRRQVLAPLNLEPSTFATAHFNPYDMMFNATPSNFSEMKVVLSSISAVMKGSIKCSGDLASFFKVMSGTSILAHGYSTFALPTWHHCDIIYDQTTTPTAITTTPHYPSDRAIALKFLVTPTLTHNHTIARPTATCDVDASHAVTVNNGNEDFLLTRNAPTNPPTNEIPAAREFITFDESRDFTPTVLVLNPKETTTVDTWQTTLFGMIIESHELDGSPVPVPNAENVLGTENAFFAESAIPLGIVRRATTFNGISSCHMLSRTRVLQGRFKAASLLRDFTIVNVPRPVQHTHDTLVSHGLPGLNWLNNVTWIAAAQSFLGFKTITPRHREPADRFPQHVTYGTVQLFSPYTYTPVDHDIYSGPQTALLMTYFLSNLRTLFGTDPTLIECVHPYEAMPIS